MSRVTLAIPATIQAGLDSGELVRWGGTIRDKAGLIVAFLDDAPSNPSLAEAFLKRSATAVKWVPARPAMIVGGVLVAAGAVAVFAKRIQGSEFPAPACVAAYNTSLSRYLNAARDGDLEADAIGQLIADLDAVRAYVDGSGRRINLDFGNKRGQELFELVAEYSTKLADANGRDLTQLLEQGRATDLGQRQDSEDEAFEKLRRHLVAQMKILRDATW